MQLRNAGRYLILALFTLLLAFILSLLDIQQLLEHLRSARLGFVLLAGASMLFFYLPWSLNYMLFFRIPFFSALLVILSGEFFNAISPGINVGGEPVKGHLLSRLQQRPFSEQFSAVISLRLLDALWYVLFSALSLIIGVFFLRLPANIGLLAQAVLFIIVFVVLMAALRRSLALRNIVDLFTERLLRWLRFLSARAMPGFAYAQRSVNLAPLLEVKAYVHGKFNRMAAAARQFSADIRRALQRIFLARHVFLPLFLLTGASWLFIFLKTYFVFLAFGQPVSLPVAIIAWMIPSLLGTLLFVPGGFGVTETAMIALLYAWGIPPEAAAAIALVDRALFYAAELGAGSLALLVMQVRLKK